eukprot:119655-Pelagomonas_calceolata.AAC.2
MDWKPLTPLTPLNTKESAGPPPQAAHTSYTKESDAVSYAQLQSKKAASYKPKKGQAQGIEQQEVTKRERLNKGKGEENEQKAHSGTEDDIEGDRVQVKGQRHNGKPCLSSDLLQ